MLTHPEIDPNIFSIGFLTVRWYGLMYVFGFALAWVLARKRSVRSHSSIKPAQVNDLVFGDIVINTSSAGTVVLTALSGGGSSVVATTVTHLGGNQAGQFRVIGEPARTFTHTIPGGSVTITKVAAANTMSVNNLTSLILGSGIPVIDGTGQAFIGIGATLNVGANQVPGPYTGTFNVSVAYN